jgi:transcriptional regulator with XRE-family HTH domain
MGTTQSAVARLESGRAKPSLRTLEKFAAATGSVLKVTLETRNPGIAGKDMAGKKAAE